MLRLFNTYTQHRRITMAINTFVSNRDYENNNKEFAISCCLSYVSNMLDCDIDDLEFRPSTKEEDKAGIDVIVWNIYTGEEFYLDYKIRRSNVEKYWKGKQDVVVEYIQNKDIGWVKEGKNIHIVWVFPWITDDSEYLSYYGCHMSVCQELLNRAIAENRRKKTAGNGYSTTSFFLYTIDEVSEVKREFNLLGLHAEDAAE